VVVVSPGAVVSLVPSVSPDRHPTITMADSARNVRREIFTPRVSHRN
jgi:hypothetical protein